MKVRESALNAITALANGDSVRMVTAAGASRRTTLENIADHIIEDYDGISLAGSNQTIKSAFETIDRDYNLFEKPTMYVVKSFARLVNDGVTYAQQGAIVTDQHVVLALDAVGADVDLKNCLYVLDKTTYQPATLAGGNPIYLSFDVTTTPVSSHANCLAWDADRNELYLYTMNDRISIVFNATTFAEKRRVTMPAGGQIGYDNIYKQWCFVSYASDTEYAIEVYEDDLTTHVCTVSGSRMGTTQGCLFHDGLIYLPTSVDSESGDAFAGMQNIQVIDTRSHTIRSWWFEAGVEFEDMGLISENKVLVATNAGSNIKLYEMDVKDIPNRSELTEKDAIDTCVRVSRTNTTNKQTEIDGSNWAYNIDLANNFIWAFGRFTVTPAGWTTGSTGAEAYTETLYISTPFSMKSYRFSAIASNRCIVANAGHDGSRLSFRLLRGVPATSGSHVDLDIMLMGYLA